MSLIASLGRVLVTGGTGFIGRHLSRRLAALGADAVIAGRSLAPAAPAQGVEADLRTPGAARELVRRYRPDTILHLAGRRPRSSDEDPSETVALNVMASVQLLDESASLAVNRVILVGSAEEYGENVVPVDEGAALRPRSIYGASKAASTLHALAIHQTRGLPVVVVRPFSVYGPGAPASMFLAEAIDCAARGACFEMTEGLQRRDFIYVSDVVEGLLAAATSPAAVGQVFNLGSGESHAMRDVAETLWRISGTSAELKIGARPRHPGDLAETRANIDRAKTLLNWQPRVSLEEGLRSTWAAVQHETGSI